MGLFSNPLLKTTGTPRSEAALSWPVLSFLAVFVPAIAIRLLFLAILDTEFLFYKYPYFAEKLAAGDAIGNRLADLSPFYLYFLTLFRWLTPFDWASLKVVHALVGALNCWLTAALGKQVSGSRVVGIGAGLGLAAYGNLIILETTLEPTVFVIFFNLLALYCLYQHADQGEVSNGNFTHRWLLLSALFTGLAIITKPSFLLFIPLACLWLALQPGQGKTILKTAVTLTLFCTVAFSIVFTITLRNYLLLDDVILVTADAGKVFFHGNSKDATVVEWAGLPDQGFVEENAEEPDYAHEAFRRAASKRTGRELSPSESSKFWTRRTVADITADPGRYLRRQLDKFLFFFSGYELHYIASAYQEYKVSLGFPFLRFSGIITLGLSGMMLMIGHISRLLPLYGLVLLYLTSGMIYVVQSRYRIPAAPYLCLFAAMAIQHIYQSWRRKRFTVVLTVLGSALAVYVVSNALLDAKITANDRWFQATKIHYEIEARVKFKSGQYAQAIEAATRALALEPNFGPAYNLRGKGYALLGDNQAAIKDFEIVIRIHPNHAEGYRNLGFAYLLEKNKEKARQYLEKALTLNPADKKVQDALNGIE